MSSVFIPKNYKSKLTLYQTQAAIAAIKNSFQKKLAKSLNLKRVSSPLFVDSQSGLNDNLNGVERPVKFDIKETGRYAEVVHSLAKWKRYALHKYDFRPLKGLYTDMNAIRRDEEMDNIHSIYVDQWDWEKVITEECRNIDYLKETVTLIMNAVCDTLQEVAKKYPTNAHIKREVTFITSQELEDLYPDLNPKAREDAIAKKYGTVFIMQIGDKLKSGKPHDGRAPDYDDWSLNGDILVYYEPLGHAIEISSMGIRVNKESLIDQLAKANCLERANLPFHKALLEDKLPLTMGGGIGQSRLCMLMLNKIHIGEVQASIWDDYTMQKCKEAGIELL
ncbi:MAG: aspartate--ammonia ligase [Clostridiales bacterium]|nr:aspartate--ammonia ligase [Clostridiales bacterium]